jgi:hypothetical protein
LELYLKRPENYSAWLVPAPNVQFFRIMSHDRPPRLMIQVGHVEAVTLRQKSRLPVLERREARTSNLLFLPDLHSLDLLKGQLVPGSIINPGGRRTRMAGDPLRDLDCAARIHVFGNARRTEAVTTNSF